MHKGINSLGRHALALPLLVFLLISAGVASAAPSQPQPINTSTIIVQLAKGHVAAELKAATPQTSSAAKPLTADKYGRLALAVPAGMTAEAFAQQIEAQYGSAVRFAEPNYPIEASDTIPNDVYFQTGDQYNIFFVHAPAAWDVQKDITVKRGVADSGYYQGGSDTWPAAACMNFMQTPPVAGCEDGAGHGTHVTSTICSKTNNNYAIAGLGWTCPSLYVAKVLDSSGSGSTFQLAAGIDWLREQGVRIINLSLGGHSGSSTPVQPQALLDAVNRALAADILIVAAAGNDGTDQGYNYPAQFDGVFAVAAVDGQSQRTSYSNFGPWVSGSAPGNFIWANYLNGNVAQLSGTSMATPHIAAGFGLLLSKAPCMTAGEAKAAFAASATPLTDNGMGAGLVNFQTLLAQAKNCPVGDTTPPTVDHTLPANAASNVALSAKVTVTFSEAMKGASITPSSFFVTVASTGQLVPGSVVYDGSINQAPFTAEWVVGGGNLAPATVYIAHVTTQVTDEAGNHMAQDYAWTFGTETVSGGPQIHVFIPLAKR